MADRVFIRQVDPEAFWAWQEAYEDWKFWQKKGFDYVPVEPICSYNWDEKEGRVNVFCGMLDLDLEEWSQTTNLFQEELMVQKRKIVEALRERGIDHQDARFNDGNFCLRFFRNENGEVDLDKVPRLYLIDFEIATFLDKRHEGL